MSDLDTELRQAFALLDLSNFNWLTDEEIKELPKTTKRGSMVVPLNKETFEEMKTATVFTGHWLTQSRTVMKKKRLFRIEVRMCGLSTKTTWQATAIMRKPDTVHTLWKAISEASDFVISENKNVEWDHDKCVARVTV